MRSIFLFFFFILFLNGCTEEPEVSSSNKEIVAKEQIITNKTEAQQAREEYRELQRKRLENE